MAQMTASTARRSIDRRSRSAGESAAAGIAAAAVVGAGALTDWFEGVPQALSARVARNAPHALHAASRIASPIVIRTSEAVEFTPCPGLCQLALRAVRPCS